MPPTQRLLLVSAASLALLLAGCGGDSSSTTSASPAAAESWPVAEVGSKVSVPDGPPPKKLLIKDLARGSGQPAKPGDEVEFQYVDALYSTGEVVSIALPTAPFHLELGSHDSLPGWEQGIVGMRVGGRRELVIPARLSNGEATLLQVALVNIK